MSLLPLVSIVIPVYNGAPFLADAIQSVLTQKHRPLEVIVVDDGSEDSSATIADQFGPPVRCIRKPNGGVSSARNVGIEMAQGEILGFLDADDLFTPDKLTQQLPRLLADSAREIVIGRSQYHHLSSHPGQEARFEERGEDQLMLSLVAGLFRRSVFDRVGKFDESLRFAEDWDWFLRARELGVGFLLHREIVFHQRLHTANATRQQDLNQQGMLQVFRRSIERRRNRDGKAVSLPPLSSYMEPEAPKTGITP